MRIKVGSVLLLTLLLAPFWGNTQSLFSGFEHLFTTPKVYVIHRSGDEIVLDGKPNEKQWKQAAWSDEFEDIEGAGKPSPLYSTHFKMLWDEENLYIYAELEEQHVWAYYDKQDMIVFHENDFEVFIDPDKDTHNYYEFEVNARNTLFDLVLNKPYRNGGPADIGWNAADYACQIFVDGTLNNPDDTDKKWGIEMRIPFHSLSTGEGFVQPENGDYWKINFSRVQWQTEAKDGKYVKKINPETNKSYPEDNWVWSPQGIINMHYPERWGLAFFSDKVPGKKQAVEIPQEEILGKYLWLLYYKQNQYRRENKKYALTLNELKLPAEYKDTKLTFSIHLETEGNQYHATLEAENGVVLSINQEGHFTNQQKNRK